MIKYENLANLKKKLKNIAKTQPFEKPKNPTLPALQAT
jgi:hypothetical protein